LKAHSNDTYASDRIQHEVKTAECLPQMDAGPVNVLQFQGRFAFLCERLTGAVMPVTDCTYALTADLRDKKGARVPDHFSKASPSPHFFDGP
jgi:hypothetical protein